MKLQIGLPDASEVRRASLTFTEGIHCRWKTPSGIFLGAFALRTESERHMSLSRHPEIAADCRGEKDLCISERADAMWPTIYFRNSKSVATARKNMNEMIPFMVKNAAFRRRRSVGETSWCS
jgi:hypothetical protein